MRYLIIPGGAAQILDGMRQSPGHRLAVVIVAEQITPRTGWATSSTIPRVPAHRHRPSSGCWCTGVLGLVTDAIVRWFETWALRWRPGVVVR
jgi:sulfonate transport system permease protein